MAEEKKLSGPDLTEGVSLTEFSDGGMLQAHAQGEPILVARRADTVFAIGASCTDYGAPLAEGLMADDTVRCPWHHACFSLRTGEALRAPALDPVSSWKVDVSDSSCAKAGREKRAGPASDGAGERYHRGRWRGRQCRGGNVAAGRICRRSHQPERV